jgi:hypothetical protein
MNSLHISVCEAKAILASTMCQFSRQSVSVDTVRSETGAACRQHGLRLERDVQ